MDHGDIWGQKSQEAITITLRYTCFFPSIQLSCFAGALNCRNNSLPEGLEPAISNFLLTPHHWFFSSSPDLLFPPIATSAHIPKSSASPSPVPSVAGPSSCPAPIQMTRGSLAPAACPCSLSQTSSLLYK